jgi:SNF2 family DNA or RNA helicase
MRMVRPARSLSPTWELFTLDWALLQVATDDQQPSIVLDGCLTCRCAVVLRDLISPYLLRRRKADVATQLPKKTETVLFCSLTETQRDLYRSAWRAVVHVCCVLCCAPWLCASC